MKRSSVWVLAFVCSILFFSCDNFLKGANIKRELDDAIEIANSKPVTIYVTVEPGSGSVNVERVSAKRKQSFDLVFTPSSSWQFVRWEVYDRQTGQCLDDAISFENSLSPDTKFTVTKALENLEIRPRCLLVQMTPEASSKNWANIPIKIQFNVPVDASVATSIKIEYGGVSLQDLGLFEAPVLNADQTLVTITPKPNELAAYITSQNLSVIKIDINLGISIKTQSGETILLSEKFKSYSVWYETAIEREKPVINEFFVTRVPIDGTVPELDLTLSSIPAQQKFVSKTIDDLEKSDDDILQNRTTGMVYIYGRCYDKDSGVESITVYEKRTNLQDGFSVLGTIMEERELSSEYTSTGKDIEFLYDENGNAVFRIKYTLDGDDVDPKNGAIRLRLEAKDMAGNSSVVEETVNGIVVKNFPEISVIKVNEIQLGDITVYNYLNNCFFNEGTTEHPLWSLNYQKIYDFDYEYYEQNAKKIYIKDFTAQYPDGGTVNWSSVDSYKGIQEFVYKNTVISADKLTVTMQLMNEADSECAELNYDSQLKTWNIDLKQVFNNVELSGKDIKLIVKDDLGLTGEKVLTYRKIVDCYCDDINDKNTITLMSNDNDNSFPYVCIIYKYNGQYKTGIRIFYGRKYEYYRIPDNSTECFVFQGLLGSGFISEKSKVYYPSSVGQEVPPAIETVGTPPWSFSKSQISNYVDVTITINEHSWDDNRYDGIFAYAGLTDNSVCEQGSNKIVISVPMKTLKQQENTIKLYGIKNSIRSPETPITIAKQTAEDMLQYDNYIGKLDFKQTSFNDYETFAIKYAYEDDNDIEYFKFKLNNEKEIVFIPSDYQNTDGYVNGTDNKIKYSALGTNNAAIEIPAWYLVKGTNVITYEKKDYANNSVKETVRFSYPWDMRYEALFPFSVDKQDDGNWTIQSSPWTNKYDGKLNFYNLSGSNINTSILEISLHMASYQTESGLKVFKISDVVLPEDAADSFIRMVPLSCYGAQTIFYTGSAGTTNGKNDLLMPNGNSTDSVAVQSDAPVFVHTLVTDEPYEVCKNWSIREWETHKKHIGDEVFNFTTASFQRYDIPVGQITAGQCYCVIAHYATNKAIQSEVMVRN